MLSELKMIHAQTVKAQFWRDSFFDPSLRGTRGEFFDEKKSQQKDLNITHLYSVFDADSEYHISFYPNDIFSDQNLQNIGQKLSKLRLSTSIIGTFSSGQCFFLNIFISFCSASKALSNHMKTSLVGEFAE
jgi:hypothetical protein